MASLPINLFDAAVYLCLAVAVIAGFRSGLLRSLATIFGYLVAAGLAVALTPPLSQLLVAQFHMPPAQIWAVYVGVFLGGGILLGALLRLAVSELVGPNVSAPDRAAGAAARRGPRRPAGGADGRHLRPHHSGRPRARVPERLAIAADPVGGRTARLEILAAGCRGLHRPPQAPTRALTPPSELTSR